MPGAMGAQEGFRIVQGESGTKGLLRDTPLTSEKCTEGPKAQARVWVVQREVPGQDRATDATINGTGSGER